ncbi:MAG: GGDEF domain-containing protein [Lachnospiraceae bacterium]|nr:GGDEF domain-containing protein [Lachnospiraceae bacterium]
MYVDVIAVDCMAFIYSAIILISTLILTKDKTKSTKLFIVCIIVEMVGLLCDAIDYGIDGQFVSHFIHTLIPTMSYAISGILIFSFSVYVCAVISERTDISRKVIVPSIILAILHEVIVIYGGVTGSLVRIINNESVPQKAVYNVYFMGLAAMIYLFGVICANYKHLGRRYFIALISYLFFPILATASTMIWHIADYTYASASLTLLIIHIVIQNTIINDSKVREQIFKEASYVDYLTGLKNRRAFEETVEKNKKYKNKVAIFCDLNSLKYVNDNLGHSAGDQLITKFSNILQENFPDGKLFRISGDEFVVLLKEPAIKGIDDRMSGFKKNIEEDGRIVAVGYAYGLDEDLMKIVRNAEKYMYRDKAEYYNNTGRDRRG